MTVVDGRSQYGRRSGRAPFQNTIGGFYGSYANFKPGGTLPSYYSVTRASVDYAWNGTQFAQVASGAPSFWYGKGLAVFGAATNLALWSSDISNAAWAVASASKSAANSIFASGGVAQKITLSGASGGVQQVVGTFTGASEIFYGIIEQGNDTSNRVIVYNVTGAANVVVAGITWATDTVSLVSGAGTVGGFKLTDSGPNGGKVFLVWATYTSTAGNSRRIHFDGPTSGTFFYAHHGQLMTGTRVLPPIMTNAATATRNADVISIAIANLPWLSASPAQLYIGAQYEALQAADAVAYALCVDNSTNNERTFIRRTASSQVDATVVNATVFQYTQQRAEGGSYPGIHRGALSAKAAEFMAAADGVAFTSGASGTMSASLTTLHVGCDPTGAAQLNGFLGSIYAGATTQSQAWLNGRTSSSSY